MYGIAALQEAQKNPPQALQRAQEQPVGPGVPPDLLRVMAAQLASEKLADAQRQLQMQAPAQSRTVADQVGQELAQRSQQEVARQVAPVMQQSAPQGVAGLPAPNITTKAMASGGIVGYAKGGSADRERYIQMIRDEAERQGMDPELAVRMFMQESSLDPKAVSPVGAAGLAQLMPGTAREMGLSEADRFTPEKAIPAGIGYFMQQQERFGDPKVAAAAYNWGPGAVGRRLREVGGDFSKVKLPDETANYLTKLFPASTAEAAEVPTPQPAAAAPAKPNRAPSMNEQAYQQLERKGSIYDPYFGLPPEERAARASADEAAAQARKPRTITLPAGTSQQDAELVRMQNPDANVSIAGSGGIFDALKRGLTYSSDVETQRMRATPNETPAETARLARQAPIGTPSTAADPTLFAQAPEQELTGSDTPRMSAPPTPQPAPAQAGVQTPTQDGLGRFMEMYGTPRQKQLDREREAYQRMLDARRAAVPAQQSGIGALLRNLPTVWRDPRTGRVVGGGYGSAISQANQAVEAQNLARLQALADIESKAYLGEAAGSTKQSELDLARYEAGEKARTPKEPTRTENERVLAQVQALRASGRNKEAQELLDQWQSVTNRERGVTADSRAVQQAELALSRDPKARALQKGLDEIYGKPFPAKGDEARAAQYLQQLEAIRTEKYKAFGAAGGGGAGPTIGTIEKGYRYKGGDPSKPASWEKVN